MRRELQRVATENGTTMTCKKQGNHETMILTPFLSADIKTQQGFQSLLPILLLPPRLFKVG